MVLVFRPDNFLDKGIIVIILSRSGTFTLKSSTFSNKYLISVEAELHVISDSSADHLNNSIHCGP